MVLPWTSYCPEPGVQCPIDFDCKDQRPCWILNLDRRLCAVRLERVRVRARGFQSTSNDCGLRIKFKAQSAFIRIDSVHAQARRSRWALVPTVEQAGRHSLDLTERARRRSLRRQNCLAASPGHRDLVNPGTSIDWRLRSVASS